MALASRRNIIIVAALAVVALAVVAWMLMDEDSIDPEAPPQVSIVPLYQNLGTLVVNLIDENEETHYMQVDVVLMTRNAKYAKTLESYVPVFRNALLELFSNQSYKVMLIPKNRAQLRADARELVLKVASRKMKQAQVEDVLFTSLVIQ
ncbi:flagellar basal body-associated FliL family protein [Parendozoicomonas sp. Alg238-R29]|uniref:flagellar basal body-associated FliL family protein n=1 Tax=Parendozoicomonas sp. Alg238-R29 TaxID=2993446 RepID=UPI00248F40CC|nr:flagellar basal body-associated FliL family protein [Parendozoicomonas sp. Alg238-R29]